MASQITSTFLRHASSTAAVSGWWRPAVKPLSIHPERDHWGPLNLERRGKGQGTDETCESLQSGSRIHLLLEGLPYSPKLVSINAARFLIISIGRLSHNSFRPEVN